MTASQGRVRRFALHTLVVLFCAVMIGGGVRGIVTGDLRFAWGMFAHVISYRVDVVFVDAAGGRTAVEPGDALKGRSRRIGPGRHRTGYGIGSVRRQVDGWLRWLWQHDKPPDAVAVEATVSWRRDGAEGQSEVRRHPEASR